MKRLTTFNLETVVIQVTTRCPYSCPQCYMKRGNENISKDAFKRAVDEAARNGAQAVQLTGGEPVLHEELAELIDYTRGCGLLSVVATSGYNASYEYYRRLKQAGLSAICVSLNGITREASLLSREALDKSLYAIKCAIQAELICFVNTVVSDENVDELNLLGRYVRDKGVIGVNILRPVCSYDEKYAPSISQDTIIKIEMAVKSMPDFYRVENCYKEYWRYISGNEFACKDIGEKTYFINADGTFSPCSKLLKHKYPTLNDMINAHEWKMGCR